MTAKVDHSELVRGRWSSAHDRDRFTVQNPATGADLAVVQGGGADEVDAAVKAAHQGFLSWRRRSAPERGRALREAARLVRSHADELASLECAEMGKPVSQARQYDLEACPAIFDFFAGLTADLPGAAREGAATIDLTTLRPYGVVGGILPFNWPPIHTAGKAAPALAVGNAIVIKPPEQAPLTVMRIVELLQRALPDDVVHVVPGGVAAGAALAGHPLVRKLSFTGAPSTGVAVIRAAAGNLTPTLMELGGKNPLIICADADLDAAVAGAIEGGFFNQGEACTAASRVLVHRSVHDRVVERLAAAVSRLRVGDGADPATHIGPLVTGEQRQSVLDHIEIGIAEGATIAAQAPLRDDPELANGFYVAPTLFTGVRPEMRIAQEEIFGPVVAVIAFDDEDEAVRIANGTDFGLVAAVYSADWARAMRIAREIEAGTVLVNNYERVVIGSPFGGTGHSGYGREHAAETLREYGYTTNLRLPSGAEHVRRWKAVDEVLDA